ncbi:MULTISPECIES: BA14K family protein [Alphaproteobacteria]|uniref:Lectin-like protein BA14k n=2 Tax=Alphaproteobacteria TaxID=28211 RepID=A0A512HEP6_9HYPH|nr:MULTISPECIES: BA14K family protein [Alphaproteobacteria]GEO83907.1 membrane protein [Ciceribacter naphthalenivorans]GLR21215.1 membrane protein [Ciceribacter naphthalenivorans]GLT04071.1 membrane protein [Sphingomonas psychrolutea]
MMNFAKYTLLAAVIAAAPLGASTQAVAGDYYHRRHHNDAFAAGALGLAAGLVTGAVIASQPRTVYVEPEPVYVERAPRRVYVEPEPAYVNDYPPAPRPVYRAAVEPWSPDWYDYCSARYRSFNPRSGTYVGYDGRAHFCTAG